MDRPSLGVRYRYGLRKAVGTSAGPYGYTLTIWTSGAVLIHARGIPTTGEALLFMLGNVAAFAAVGALAFRPTSVSHAAGSSHPVLWGSFHFVPVTLSIGAASLVAHLVEHGAAWPIAGVAATAIYLSFVAAQITFFEQQVFEDLEHEVEGEVEAVRDEAKRV